MRLTELNPKWIGIGVETHVLIVGIRFDCPHCRNHRIALNFSPIDKNGWDKMGIEIPKFETMWKRSGEDFESLTLDPSIDIKNHWHGFIQNGEIKSC